MMRINDNQSTSALFIGMWLALTAGLFALTSAPMMFFANQNTYLFPALSALQPQHFTADFLRTTTDAFPLFTAITRITLAHTANIFFTLQALYAVLIALFAVGCISLIQTMTQAAAPQLRLRSRLFATTLFAVLCGMSWVEEPLSYFSIAISGMASQSLLGGGSHGYWQPSEGGVFLMLALAALAKNRPFAAVLCIVFTCLFSPSYLASTGLLLMTIALLAACSLLDLRRTVLALLAAIPLLLPIVYYSYIHFIAGFEPEIRSSAARFLV